MDVDIDTDTDIHTNTDLDIDSVTADTIVDIDIDVNVDIDLGTDADTNMDTDRDIGVDIDTHKHGYRHSLICTCIYTEIGCLQSGMADRSVLNQLRRLGASGGHWRGVSPPAGSRRQNPVLQLILLPIAQSRSITHFRPKVVSIYVLA